MPPGFPTIDKWNSKTGVATSIKSVDLASKTYQSASRLKSLLKKYIDKMAAFQGATHVGRTIDPSEINQRVLHIAVPQKASDEQEAVIASMLEYAHEKGVDLIVETIR